MKNLLIILVSTIGLFISSFILGLNIGEENNGLNIVWIFILLFSVLTLQINITILYGRTIKKI